MRILGIDPGFDRVGLGVVDVQGSALTWVYHGCLQTDKRSEFSFRLQQVRDAVQKTISHFSPELVCVEELFFSKNAKTAMRVGAARGVILLAIADAGVRMLELTPNQIKQGLTGYGKADKQAMQSMVKQQLHLEEIPRPDDAADALALAIVGAHAARHPEMRAR